MISCVDWDRYWFDLLSLVRWASGPAKMDSLVIRRRKRLSHMPLAFAWVSLTAGRDSGSGSAP